MEDMLFLAIVVITGVNFGVKLVARPSRIQDSVKIFEIRIITALTQTLFLSNTSPTIASTWYMSENVCF